MKKTSLNPEFLKKQIDQGMKANYAQNEDAKERRIQTSVEYLNENIRLPVAVTDIPGMVGRLMKEVNDLLGMTGPMKKEVVVRTMKNLCPIDAIDEMIPLLIDYFYDIDVNGLLRNIVQHNPGCFPCLHKKK